MRTFPNPPLVFDRSLFFPRGAATIMVKDPILGIISIDTTTSPSSGAINFYYQGVTYYVATQAGVSSYLRVKHPTLGNRYLKIGTGGAPKLFGFDPTVMEYAVSRLNPRTFTNGTMKYAVSRSNQRTFPNSSLDITVDRMNQRTFANGSLVFEEGRDDPRTFSNPSTGWAKV